MMRRALKIVGSVLLVALSASAHAKDVAPTLDEMMKNAKKEGGAFPRVVTFVTDLPEGEMPEFLPLDADAFNAASYIQAASPASAEWNYKLNGEKYAEMDSFDLAVALTGADTVVMAPAKGEWQMLQGKAVKGGPAKKKVLYKGKAPKSKKAADLAAWFFTALNWDGVVIEQQGDFLLVGSRAVSLKSLEIQALAVEDSKDKTALTASERKGSGLLSLSEAKGGYGIFDIVLLGQGVKALPTGTKLILEKKKK